MNNIIIQKLKKIKQKISKKLNFLWISINSQTGFFIIILIFMSTLSFFLGKLSVINTPPTEKRNETIITKNTNLNTTNQTNISKKTKNEIQVIASKKGKTYYYLWCTGYNRIKKSNQKIFKNEEEAKKNGLRLAKNCKK